jgi:hypothetical protein
MKKILLVSGCSFTTSNYVSQAHPSMDCSWPKWPELIAEKMDLELVNLAQSGRGNEYIFSTIYDYIITNGIENIGYVFIAWSQVQRRDYATKKYGGDTKWATENHDIRGDLYYDIEKSLRYYGMFQALMEKYKFSQYKQFQMIEPFKDNFANLSVANKHVNKQACMKIWESSPLSKIINRRHFIGWPSHVSSTQNRFSIEQIVTENRTLREYQISRSDSHPNKLGHEKYAEFIYKHI